MDKRSCSIITVILSIVAFLIAAAAVFYVVSHFIDKKRNKYLNFIDCDCDYNNEDEIEAV